MNLKRPPRNPESCSEHECDEARLARLDAIDRYFMALDREEHAARGYRHAVEQTHA